MSVWRYSTIGVGQGCGDQNTALGGAHGSGADGIAIVLNDLSKWTKSLRGIDMGEFDELSAPHCGRLAQDRAMVARRA